MRAVRYAAPAAVLALALGACGGSDEPGGPGAASPSSPATTPASTPPSTPATPSTTTGPPPTGSSPSGGTADRPAVLEPGTDLLDWRPVGGSVRDEVTRSSSWTLTVTGNGRGYSLEGTSSGSSTGSAGSATRVKEALLDGDWAAVVLQDRNEEGPQRAEVTDLGDGSTFRVDGRSDVPTTTGGDWALGEGTLLHATVRRDGSYCLASVDLATRASTLEWCAPKRHGFNDTRVTPGGTSVLTFDLGNPDRTSCRTLVAIEDGRATPFTGVPDCRAWEGLLTDAGAVWSVIPQEHQVERAHFYSRVGEGYFDLGPGTAGSLTWCAGAAYFVRDPQREGDPAALMRWSADTGLAVVYESPGGRAFLSEPRCGGDTMTVAALAEDGDEQVSASLR